MCLRLRKEFERALRHTSLTHCIPEIFIYPFAKRRGKEIAKRWRGKERPHEREIDRSGKLGRRNIFSSLIAMQPEIYRYIAMEKPGNIFFVRPLKMSVSIVLAGVICYCLTIAIRETYFSELLKSFTNILDIALLLSIVVMAIPSKALGLPIAGDMMIVSPSTIFGWLLGFIFLFIIIFAICLIFSLLIEELKHVDK